MSDYGRTDDERLLPWLALGLALLAGVFVLTQGWFGGFREVQAVSNHLPGWFWQSLTVLGDERVLLALMLPFCRRYPRVFWSIIVAAVIGGLVSRGIKIWLEMPRPAAMFAADQITILGIRLTSKSFPSGHTVSAFSFVSVWLAIGGWRLWPLLPLAVLAGFSRVAVGAHWPFDVLVAACIGVLGAWLGVKLARRWRWGLRVRPHRGLVCIAALAVATLPFESQGYPDSLAVRLLVCVWGLSAFAIHYLLPLLRGGWRGGVQSDSEA